MPTPAETMTARKPWCVMWAHREREHSRLFPCEQLAREFRAGLWDNPVNWNVRGINLTTRTPF